VCCVFLFVLYLQPGPEAAAKALEIMWELIQDNSGASDSIVACARIKFGEVCVCVCLYVCVCVCVSNDRFSLLSKFFIKCVCMFLFERHVRFMRSQWVHARVVIYILTPLSSFVHTGLVCVCMCVYVCVCVCVCVCGVCGFRFSPTWILKINAWSMC